MKRMSDITYMIIAAAVIFYGILSFLVGTKMNSFRTVKNMDEYSENQMKIYQKNIAKPKFLYVKEIPGDLAQTSLTRTPKEKIYL